MKLRIAPLLAIFVSLICAGFLGYKGYQWWQKHQKRKALFLYFQKNSPVTKRIPKDAFLYINLYDVKRVHDQMRDSNFSEVLAHWLDTGMAENEKPNPLLGGMLERTMLNIIGEEFVIALLPSNERPFDFLAVARIAPGSDFLLNLALSSAKNVEKIDSGDKIFYRAKTKDVNFPSVTLYVQENLAYASNNFERLKDSYSKEEGGPDFLKASSVEGIPEDTVIFAQHQDPEIRALLFGSGKSYRIRVSDIPAVDAHAPEIESSSSDVIKIQTNGPGLVHQPAATYLLQTSNGAPVSAVLLSFSKPVEATHFQQRVAQLFEAPVPESFLKNGIECMSHVSRGREEFVCRQGVSLLLARGQFPVNKAKFLSKAPTGQTPFVLRLDFNQQSISDYRKRVETKDWSRFNDGGAAFYFLSCIERITGSIDGKNREIAVELN